MEQEPPQYLNSVKELHSRYIEAENSLLDLWLNTVQSSQYSLMLLSDGLGALLSFRKVCVKSSYL